MLDEARSELAAAGDIDGAAEADLALAESWWWIGDRDRCSACLGRAAELIREGDSIATRASVLSQVARFHSLFGDQEAAVEHAQESLRLAEALERDDLRAKNLVTLGTASFYLPDADSKVALADVQAGIDLAEASGEFSQLSRGYMNLASLLQQAGKLEQADSVVRSAADLAQRRGHAAGVRFAEGNLIDGDLASGRWDSAERRARAFLEESGIEGHYMDNIAVMALSLIELARDQTDLALQHADEALPPDDGSGIHRRWFRRSQAERSCTRSWVRQGAQKPFSRSSSQARTSPPSPLHSLRPRDWVSPTSSAWRPARSCATPRGSGCGCCPGWALGGRSRDLRRDRYRRVRGSRGSSRGRVLRPRRSRAEANEQLARSLPFWRSIDASRFIREAEALLAKSA